MAIPKLREGSYFPEWLLERRKRAEQALTTVVDFDRPVIPRVWTSLSIRRVGHPEEHPSYTTTQDLTEP